MARVTYRAPVSATTAAWAGDEFSREHVLAGGAMLTASTFEKEDSVLVTTSGVAAIAATSIPVTALSGPIPLGAILDFTGAGEFAKLTAAAVAGATSLSVEALDAAVESGDTALYAGSPAKKKRVYSGTLVGRTVAERAAGTGFGPYAGGDDEVYLVLHDIIDVDMDPSVTLYRNGSLVYETKLPAATIAQIAVVRSKYQTIL